MTVRSDGDAVTTSVGQKEVELVVELLPLLAFTTLKSWGRAVTTIDIVAVQPWLSVSVSVKVSVAAVFSARNCASST